MINLETILKNSKMGEIMGELSNICAVLGPDGNKYVIKRISPDKYKTEKGEPTTQMHRNIAITFAENEFKTMQQANNPYFPKPFDFYIHQGREAYILMEHFEGETFRLARNKTREIETFRLLKEIGKAVQTMHEKGIILQDIHDDNIIVTKDGKIKIIDLELARRPKICYLKGTLNEANYCGTQGFITPEQNKFFQQKTENPKISQKSDIYQLGIILKDTLELRLRRKSQEGITTISIHFRENERLEQYEDLKFFLKRSLNETPQYRPTSKDFAQMMEQCEKYFTRNPNKKLLYR